MKTEFVVVSHNHPKNKGLDVYLQRVGKKVFWTDVLKDARRFDTRETASEICFLLDPADKGHMDPQVIPVPIRKKHNPEDTVHILLTVNQIQRQMATMIDMLEKIVNHLSPIHEDEDEEEFDREREEVDPIEEGDEEDGDD
jgi:hypothetical protein